MEVEDAQIKRAASRVMERCDKLAACSDDPHCITRLFLSPAMRDAHDLVGIWMREAGLETHVSPYGNLTGIRGPAKPRIVIGSHLDSVKNAGRYDGVLGVIVGIEIASMLMDIEDIPMEIIGFSEEEGVRYNCPYIGSMGRIGGFDPELLDRVDENGIPMRKAIRDFGLDPDVVKKSESGNLNIKAFLELHIEQGPLMASRNEAVAVVDSIVGQTRRRLTFIGEPQHAGTCPMNLRKDALVATSEWIMKVEREGRKIPGLVATVGRIVCKPNTPNVIPGEVEVSLDVRYFDDDVRNDIVDELVESAERLAEKRGLEINMKRDLDHEAIHMDKKITRILQKTLVDIGLRQESISSGAGHDSAIMADAVPTGLIFIRSPNGLSHHPDELILQEDLEKALVVMKQAVLNIHAAE